MRKQLGTKNSKSNEGRQEKNGGVNGRDGSAEELERETGEADRRRTVEIILFLPCSRNAAALFGSL